MKYIAARLKEPSTWAGLSASFAALVSLHPDFAVAAIVCGALAAGLREAGNP